VKKYQSTSGTLQTLTIWKLWKRRHE